MYDYTVILYTHPPGGKIICIIEMWGTFFYFFFTFLHFTPYSKNIFTLFAFLFINMMFRNQLVS